MEEILLSLLPSGHWVVVVHVVVHVRVDMILHLVGLVEVLLGLLLVELPLEGAESVLLLVSGEGVGVDHGEHLGEALANLCDPFGGVSEGELVPREVVGLLPLQIYDVLLTGRTAHPSQWLLGEHGVVVVFVVGVASRHEEVVEVLELPLQELQRLLRVVLVSQLLRQRLHQLIHPLHQHLLQVLQSFHVHLLVEGVLHFLDPLGELVLQVVQVLRQLVDLQTQIPVLVLPHRLPRLPEVHRRARRRHLRHLQLVDLLLQ
mmetsp:Transcript_23621/g.23313  ORF Transcript_23621/g.23313 Transcript_23621/m.23313 type:complete len:260 (+) Transcript_23621:144-923(+)